MADWKITGKLKKTQKMYNRINKENEELSTKPKNLSNFLKKHQTNKKKMSIPANS
tara:strand:+ start:2826 stop:2990 length:165 start_codon:yes stop_codon:yes gene_type:complete